MKLDNFFKFLLVTLFILALPQLYIFKSEISIRQSASHFYPRLHHLMYYQIIAVALTIVQLACNPVFKAIGRKMIAEHKSRSEIRELKIARFSNMSTRMVYYISVTAFAYFSLKNSEWFPEALGGSGDFSLIWQDYPLQDNRGFLSLYFFISGGYQLYSLIFLLSEPPAPDFWENLLGNSCALLLLGFSYMANMLRLGSIILLCHDVCDIFSSGCKALVNTSLKPLTFSLFLCLMASWAYLRLYCFPMLCLNSVLSESYLYIPPYEQLGISWMALLLLVQLLLNIYWFLLMFKMLFHFLSSGQTVDMHSPVISEAKKIE